MRDGDLVPHEGERSPSLPERAARIIADSFRSYVQGFRDVTRNAREHFESANWRGVQHDAALRFDLYADAVHAGLLRLRPLLGAQAEDRPTWTALRAAYARAISGRGDVELAESFFNSFTRKIFHTIGVDPSVEFISSGGFTPHPPDPGTTTVRFPRAGSLRRLVREILSAYRFAPGWEDADGDAGRVAIAMEDRLDAREVRGVELARPVFFRGKAAYLVGRVETDRGDVPLVLALTNPAGKIVVDAVLLDENDVSIVFSFARSYFFVEMERPLEIVSFLKTIMPRKPIAELYNAVGCNKHGKTELYRSILRHLETTDDRFEIAPGQRGMVMSVFTLPGLDVVFKVIKDRFDYPKTVTHQEVRDKYRLVFRHDRAGRLVDAQEFEHLEFDRARFSEGLLRELGEVAAETVEVRGAGVVIRHLYTERRLRPLDVYLRSSGAQAARDAIVEYGQVLRDLAATNIFPGDMLLKNFGVTRHGRLIFYDYDELCLLTECNFRVLPAPKTDLEEVSSEPWFYVGDRDIFPEEFRSFLGLRKDLLHTFLAHHEELLHVDFWHRMQDLHHRGEVVDIFPYRGSSRLRGADEELRR
jgi:isocitrate dehydrogenase kinase/phosphatase